MQKRLDSVDALRGLAVFGVVLTHCKLSANFLPEKVRFWILIPYSYGGVGVVLFIVLSGFCIHLAFAKKIADKAKNSEKKVSWTLFWKRRFWRLYPTYAIAAVISLLTYYLIGPLAYSKEDRISNILFDVIAHLLMIHNLFSNYCQGLGNGAFWSLALEEQLYVLYFVFLFLRSRFGIKITLMFTLILGLFWSLGLRYLLGISTWGASPELGNGPLALGHWMQWPFAWWFVWILGAYSAELNLRLQIMPKWATSPLVALLFGSAGIVLSYGFFQEIILISEPCAISGLSEFCFGIASFCLLNILVQKDMAGKFNGFFARVFAPLGKMSYSVYLIHLPVIFSVRHFMGAPTGSLMVLAVFLFCLLGSLLAGFVLFIMVERHFLFSGKITADK